MIELVCPKCGKTFERQGKKRGKMPYCSPCKDKTSSILENYSALKL